MSDDYVMVPREPTPEMIDAARASGAEGTREELASDYRAMIAAAPPAAPQPEQFGWFYDITTGDEKRFGPIWQGGEKREHVEIVAADVGGKVFPLYAAPPAAPLTDESVNARVAAMAADRDYWRERVLALESAAPVVRESQGIERMFAVREGLCNADETAYFAARPQLDDRVKRRIFIAGFYAGWDRGIGGGNG